MSFSLTETHGYINSNALVFSLNLEDVVEGYYRVEYLVDDQVYYQLDSGFFVEPFIAPQLSISVTGQALSRAGRFVDQYLVIENKGNVDAIMVPVVYKTVNLENAGHFGMFVDYGNIADQMDTFQTLKAEYLAQGGDSNFVNDYILSWDTTGVAIKMMAMVVPRLKPGITTYKVTTVLYGNDFRVETLAHIGQPILSSRSKCEKIKGRFQLQQC